MSTCPWGCCPTRYSSLIKVSNGRLLALGLEMLECDRIPLTVGTSAPRQLRSCSGRGCRRQQESKDPSCRAECRRADVHWTGRASVSTSEFLQEGRLCAVTGPETCGERALVTCPVGCSPNRSVSRVRQPTRTPGRLCMSCQPHLG